MQWLRLYDDVLDDPKVQQLPAELFRHWINFLCLANKSSTRGRVARDVSAIAFRLRVSEDDAARVIAEFERRELIVVNADGTLSPHNWDRRQFKSDNVNARVAAHRARNVTPQKDVTLHETLHVTAPDTDTDTEQNREEHTPLPPTGESDTDSPSGAGVSANGAKPRKPKRAKREGDDPYWTQGEHYERFRAWYSEYPRKVDPQGAMKAWREVLGDDDGDARTMNALWTLSRERWREWRGRAIEHVPYPASWLGKREWEFTREFVEAGR